MWLNELPDEVDGAENVPEFTDEKGVYLQLQVVTHSFPVVMATVKWYKDGNVYKLSEPWKTLKREAGAPHIKEKAHNINDGAIRNTTYETET